MDRKGMDLSLCRLRATESRTTAIEELKNAWNQTPAVVQARQITGKRLAAAKALLADPDWPWKEALAKFPLRCFQGDRDWKPNLDWFLRPDSALKCVEGGYDWAKGNSNGKSAGETLKEQNERAIAEGIRIAAERKRQRELAQ